MEQDNMTETQSECLNGYLTLLRDFAAGKLDARLFESTYIHKFKTERVELPENIFNVLDSFRFKFMYETGCALV